MRNSKEPVMNPTTKNLEPVGLIQRAKLEPGDLLYMLNTQTTGGHMTARLWHAQLVRRVREQSPQHVQHDNTTLAHTSSRMSASHFVLQSFQVEV